MLCALVLPRYWQDLLDSEQSKWMHFIKRNEISLLFIFVMYTQPLLFVLLILVQNVLPLPKMYFPKFVLDPFLRCCLFAMEIILFTLAGCGPSVQRIHIQF